METLRNLALVTTCAALIVAVTAFVELTRPPADPREGLSSRQAATSSRTPERALHGAPRPVAVPPEGRPLRRSATPAGPDTGRKPVAAVRAPSPILGTGPLTVNQARAMDRVMDDQLLRQIEDAVRQGDQRLEQVLRRAARQANVPESRVPAVHDSVPSATPDPGPRIPVESR